MMMAKFFIYFSEILGKAVRDDKNKRAGYLCDIAMKINGEIYPKSAGLIIKRGLFLRQFAQVPWDDIRQIDSIVRLKGSRSNIKFQNQKMKNEFSLCGDVLDQQIVDINNRKVVRVNDIHLLRVDNNLYLAHVDVGTRGLVRRLGWISLADRIVKFLSAHSSFLTQEDFIPWKNTQLLSSLGRAKNVLRLDVSQQKLSQIPATALADIMDDLGIFEKSHLFQALDIIAQRKVFADLATTKKAELIEHLDQKQVASLLENIPSDEAADLLMRLPQRKSRQFLKLMETRSSKKLSKLLGFSKNSAGGLMTVEYLSLPQTALVKDALQKVKDNTHLPGNVYYIYIVDEQNKLVGFSALRNFINADPQALLTSVMDPNKIFVRTNDNIEKVAVLLEKYKFSVIPVLNDDDLLQGVITIDDVMEELISIAWSKYKEKL